MYKYMKTEKYKAQQKCITDYVEIGTTIIYLTCVCENGSKIELQKEPGRVILHMRDENYTCLGSSVINCQKKKKKKKVIERRVAEKFKKNIMHIVM